MNIRWIIFVRVTPKAIRVFDQANFFNEKPQTIAYLKKIFALPLGLLGLATDNDS